MVDAQALLADERHPSKINLQSPEKFGVSYRPH